jgi:hypothetical protein
VKLSSELTQHLPPAFFGLPEDESRALDEAAWPEVLVIATQENASAGQWVELLQGFLTPIGYSMLPGGASMQSAPGGSFCMTVATFVRQQLKCWVTDVQVGRVTCGMGNKVRRCALASRSSLSQASPMLSACSPLGAHFLHDN